MMSVAVVVGLILVNALFVAAEFALVSAPRAAVERLVTEGSKRAKRVLDVLRDVKLQDQYIATAQLAITFASLGLGVYGEQRLAEALHEPLGLLGIDAWFSVAVLASVLAVVSLTYLHIVFGEMIPKALALRHPAAVATWLHTPTLWFKVALWPLVLGINAIGERLLRAVGVATPDAGRAQTPETLRYLVDESVAKGELEREAGEVVDELFEFSDLAAAQVMTPRVQLIGLRRHASVAEVRRIVRSARHQRYPVYENAMDQIVGMVLIRDLVQLLVHERPLSDDLVRPVSFVAATTRLDAVLARMHLSKTRMLVVMDEHGGTSGMLTPEDLFKHIVGSVPRHGVQAQPVYGVNGELHALGVARLEQVGEQLGVELKHPEVHSVSGLVLALLDRPPVVGDKVVFHGVEFVVCATQGRGVRECRLTVVQSPVSPVSG